MGNGSSGPCETAGSFIDSPFTTGGRAIDSMCRAQGEVFTGQVDRLVSSGVSRDVANDVVFDTQLSANSP